MHDDAARPRVAREPRLLIVETSHRVGLVAVALGDRMLGERRLDEARRHARDLAPAIRELLLEQGWRARDLDAVVVSRGPGSYTGLRVGVMSAKTLAYAAGCTLLAVDTFAAIARQVPAEALAVDVIADAQQDKVYVQRFARTSIAAPLFAATQLGVESFAAWQSTLTDGTWVTGPGLDRFGTLLQGHPHIELPESWFPRAASLLWLALRRVERGEKDDVFAVEPLYLRPSSAEEKWRQRDTPG
jgi:tRNA threonylcarbamoyladenosine biosynthesis protein TsaB